jgi:hypothetical protein
MLSPRVLPRKVADSEIMYSSHRAALGILHDAMPKIVEAPLTLHSCSFLECGNEYILCLFCLYTDQYFHFGRM